MSQCRTFLLVALAMISVACTTVSIKDSGDAQSRPVHFTRLSMVHGSGFDKPGQFMVRNRVEWHNLWLKVQQGVTPYAPLPPIDFNKYMILVVTRGLVTVGGHPIKIERITETDQAVHVQVVRETPGTCYTSEGYTYPTDAVLIPRTQKPIRWSYRDEIVDCPGAALR